MFAKIFDTAERGQILVKLDSSPNAAPEVRFYAEPDGLGVCSLAVEWADDDAGWEAAEAAFNSVDEAKALEVCADLFAVADGMA